MTKQQLTDALVDWVGPRGKANVDVGGPSSKYSGFVVHPDFTGVAVNTRQGWLWDFLRKHFGADSQQVGIIFTYSPYEYEEMFAESTND